MTGTNDPDATRPINEGGDATEPAPRVPDATQPVTRVPAGPPPGPPPGGPEGPYDDEDPDRRSWWGLAAVILLLGILVGVGVALLADSGDDDPADATTTTSSSTTTSSTTAATLPPPTSPPTVPAAPGQVTNVIAGPGGGSGEVSLEWDSVSGAVSYRIYRSFTQGTSGSLVATVDTTSYTDVPGQKSYYQVSAVGSGGLEGQRSVETCGAPTGEMC
jgi:hypothetical protein